MRLYSRSVMGFSLAWLVFTLGMSTLLVGGINTSAQNLPADSALPASARQEAVPTSTLPPVQDLQFDLGIHVRETQPTVEEAVMAGYMDAARNQLNLNWIKVQMRWDFIEPHPDEYNWANWDMVFRLAAENDLKVLVTVIGSPQWARAPASNAVVDAPPQDPAVLALFIGNLLRRYPNQIHALEIWYGMNVSSHWSSPDGLNPVSYVQMMSVVHSMVRKIDANIIVISGGLEPTADGVDGNSVDDFRYMDGLLEAGLTNYIDCVGVHHRGYNIPPGVPFDAVPADDSAVFRGPFDNPHHSWSFSSTLNTYARKIAAAGFSTPLCVTEFGWASSEDLGSAPSNLRFAADNSLQEQAAWTLEAIQLMQTSGFVRLAFLWNLNIGAEEGFNPQNPGVPYSLIRPGYAVAPAWLSIAELNFRELP